MGGGGWGGGMPKVIPVSLSRLGVPTLILDPYTQAAADRENGGRAAVQKHVWGPLPKLPFHWI